MTPMEQYAQYNNSKVLTASPAELVLMLYEGAIKFCNIAIMAIEKEDGERAHNYIIKVERIIDELRLSLDSKYEIAEDFEQIYVYLIQRLLEANIKKDPEILKEVILHLRSVRDNWKKVMEANQTMKGNVPTAVNQ
jgi:flagellar protein FliS